MSDGSEHLQAEREQTEAERLQSLYDTDEAWGEHPLYRLEAWRWDVSEGNTRSGYWDWVVAQIALQGSEPSDDAPQTAPEGLHAA